MEWCEQYMEWRKWHKARKQELQPKKIWMVPEYYVRCPKNQEERLASDCLKCEHLADYSNEQHVECSYPVKFDNGKPGDTP